ncbi:MAG: hypothetical protein HRU25_17000 [Psychrobium sp.]|nr:hypothetical protein [Psychrobium sp.]
MIIKGELTVSRVTTQSLTTTKLIADSMQFHFTDEQVLHLSQLSTEKVEHYDTAQLQIQMVENF